MTDILESSAMGPGLWVKKYIMEVNTPIALVCFERALPLPTSSPSMHNQLSNLTYLPEACEAHGTGLAVVQKVPMYKKFAPRQIFWASGFPLCTDIDWRCGCDACTAHSAPPCLLPRRRTVVCSPLSTHTHTSTPADTFLRTHTSRPKGGKGTKEKLNDLHAS